ncbi:MAG: CatB-related O-acetyltransferase [Candidatus Aminicenantes bacterium]|nr:CatB-related O-acetyltransferase [Candidatus Aminicenantes bacterium]
MRNVISKLLLRPIGRLSSKGLAALRSPQPWIDSGVLSLGAYSYEAPEVIHFEGDKNKVVIGKFCSISRDVKIFVGGNHPSRWVSSFPFRVRFDLPGKFQDGHPASRGDVVIGNDVWIGMAATILSGVKIGHGAIVAARSFVVKNVPPYAVVGGNPAEFLFYRFKEEYIRALLEIKWWDWPIQKILDSVPLLNGGSVEEFIRFARRPL